MACDGVTRCVPPPWTAAPAGPLRRVVVRCLTADAQTEDVLVPLSEYSKPTVSDLLKEVRRRVVRVPASDVREIFLEGGARLAHFDCLESLITPEDRIFSVPADVPLDVITQPVGDCRVALRERRARTPSPIQSTRSAPWGRPQRRRHCEIPPPELDAYPATPAQASRRRSRRWPPPPPELAGEGEPASWDTAAEASERGQARGHLRSRSRSRGRRRASARPKSQAWRSLAPPWEPARAPRAPVPAPAQPELPVAARLGGQVPWRRRWRKPQRDRMKVKEEVKAEASGGSDVEAGSVCTGELVEIGGRVGWMVDCIDLRFSDGSMQSYGGDGGSPLEPHPLAPGEVVTAVEQLESGRYLGGSIAFFTSTSKVIQVAGSQQGKKWKRRRLAVPEGHTLRGLIIEGSTLVGLRTVVATVRSSDEEAAACDEDDRQEHQGSDAAAWEEHVRRVTELQSGLVRRWRQASKPKKRPGFDPDLSFDFAEFADQLQNWFAQRGFDSLLHREPRDDEEGWIPFRYEPVRRWVVPGRDWVTVYHGTWWYALALLLGSGVVLESSEEERGHEFWTRGVFCSPVLDTARRHARPQILFNDGLFHRVVLEVRVDRGQCLRQRRRGGEQWVFPAQAAAIDKVLVQANAPPAKGEERLMDWDQALEAYPMDMTECEPAPNPGSPMFRDSVGSILAPEANPSDIMAESDHAPSHVIPTPRGSVGRMLDS